MGKELGKRVILDSSESLEYFESCARIRDISVPVLLNRILSRVARDQLVFAILDDGSARCRKPGEKSYKVSR